MKSFKKIISLLMVLTMACCMVIPAYAANVADATIDTAKTGSINIYKYDLTNAEKDGVWDSSYVSTGVKDADGVEAILGDSSRVSPLNANGEASGYTIKGVEFTYLKVGDIRTYTEAESGEEHVEVLYGIAPNTANNAFLAAIGVSASDRYAPADEGGINYYRSDVLINGLKAALEANSSTVKNALENYVTKNGGLKMTQTDGYGHTSVNGLPLGLYLIVETKVPEMVTETTAPFFISLPMTSVNGTNATDGGERWIYDVTVYPKNLTGIPSLEKTVREALADTGKNGGSVAITDGYAHTATASESDVVDYQIISTLPSITSAASYLTDYSFVDTISAGLAYTKGDVKIEFFRDASCAAAGKIASWGESDGKFSVAYNGTTGMTISMTQAGLEEINTSKAVYTESAMVNSGYSDCTMRITYSAKLNASKALVCGDAGNDNKVVLTWKRTNTDYYDTLIDDCHVFSYGIDLTKKFSDGQGDFSKVEFIIHNDTDGYFVTAALNADEGIYYVTGHKSAEADATHFIPTSEGSVIVKGLEDDTYTVTEVRTSNGYTLLRDDIEIVISQEEGSTLCEIYEEDVLGVLQNDPRYANVEPGLYKNMPQKELEHYMLTASATVDENDVTMDADGASENALAPLTVINTKGFTLPKTGGSGTWMYPAVGLTLMAAAAASVLTLLKKKKSDEEA